VPVDDPVYGYLDYMATRGIIPEIRDNSRPLTRNTVARNLEKIYRHTDKLTPQERGILREYLADYRYELAGKLPDLYRSSRHFLLPDNKNSYFALGSFRNLRHGIGRIFSYTPQQEPLHLLVYEQDSAFVWLDWNEMTRLEMKDDLARGIIQHAYRLSMQLSPNITLYSDFYNYNQQIRDGFSELIPEYKGGYYKDETQVDHRTADYTSFDYTHAYIQYSSQLGLLRFGMQPMYWGNGPQSMILSNSALAFPAIQWSKRMGKAQFTFVHGNLSHIPDDSSAASRYFVSHRLEFALSPRLQAGFTEILIYGDQKPDPTYLIPTVFLWSAQHNSVDRDHTNMLLAFEVEYYPMNRAKLFGTFLLDELRPSNIAKSWWGNKFGVQGGLSVTPRLPGFMTKWTAEYTAVRPWTYTHIDPAISSFTNSGIGLGFPPGPNSQQFLLEGEWWVNPRHRLVLEYTALRHGVPAASSPFPVGGDPYSSYKNRNSDLDFHTPWLLGNIVHTRNIGLSWRWAMSDVLYLSAGYRFSQAADQHNHLFSLQLRADY